MPSSSQASGTTVRSAASEKRKDPPNAAPPSSSDDEYVLSMPAPPSSAAAATATSSSEATTPDAGTASKKPKLAPIFNMGKTSTTTTSSGVPGDGAGPSSAAGQFNWHEPLGPAKSCLHASFRSPKPSTKLALFDLDGTLVRPKSNKQFPSARDEYDFKFCFQNVVSKVQQAHGEGYAIVVVSNQKQTQYSGSVKLETWRKKVVHVARALDVPLRIFAALADDQYRKPRLGIWTELQERFNGGLAPDLASSYYVGDAAGRKSMTAKDHNDTDYKWALNAGLRFLTPEQFFVDAKEQLAIPARPWEAKPSSLERLPIFGGSGPEADLSDAVFHPSDTPLVPADRHTEVILFVGPPASGKTAFFRRHLDPAGYIWINQDTLKTRDKCVAAVRECIAEGKSCVVDNTNRDKATRRHYIALAQASSIPIRAFFFDVAKATCQHNNQFRAMGAGPIDEPRRDVVPPSAIEAFFRDVQPPKIDEGFAEEPKRIRWNFEGDEELRSRYERYYL
ncbi:uncharacterized protein PFL1_00158 [Pseudozyma flocculosa PF-1]|uniref:Related to bifunctional polynucleotide phosphatase/kinase n=1 Tax=Pseudozyma flocculosa TaxID=84751 RepID=A0A5C3EUA9_9BASI|nr:uncharacterized protein PFL1_00158 [Pseudozyma flocculosa PF-1]EPQ31959.1 hypothetical protein PFL1_00158 [Pseudozyma flocculosa PF-1]SPO35126.1 related to bifunctional polynucleotide phosphatase/kinase [Pseudozyma flocculosa]